MRQRHVITLPELGISRATLLRLFVLAMATILLVLNAAPIQAAGADRSTSAVYSFADGSVVTGATSTLVRTDSGVRMTLHTSGLTPGDAVTVWWVVFNAPENCVDPTPVSQCGEGDLPIFGGDDSAETAVLHAAGHVIGGSGKGNFGAHLGVGDTTGALWGTLTDSRGAEIHLVVRSHGPALPGLVNEQIHTFGGGCDDAPPGTGTPGPNTCEELQFAVHE